MPKAYVRATFRMAATVEVTDEEVKAVVAEYGFNDINSGEATRIAALRKLSLLSHTSFPTADDPSSYSTCEGYTAEIIRD